MLQAIIDQTYAKFVSVVEKGRSRAQRENHGEGKALSSTWKEFADGRILTGRQAFELGFVDELGDFDTAVRTARRLSKITDANVIRYQEPFSLGSLFGLFGQSQAGHLKIDLGIELPNLHAGRLYFLAPTVIH